MPDRSTFDLAIIGGGVNGCGIAADAAGRGLSVLLAEMGDLAGATSSASSKLVHGGLRYLEHYEFRLVREALAEREVLLAMAPHLIWPLRFVLPDAPGQRPRWMIQAGLLLYDHLYRRKLIPASDSVDLKTDPAGAPLVPGLKRGFSYWDCWVDDARLVVLNAQAAVERGAEILTRWQAVSARPDGHYWVVRLVCGNQVREIRARALVNAGGPFADRVADTLDAAAKAPRPTLRLVKGSHIVVPRIAGADDAYLLQNTDGRVVFALPYEDRFTLIGTTDVPYAGDPASVAIDADEETYLLDVALRFFKTPPRRADIVWRFSGVRPLYDDQSANPSAVTRDYRLDLSAGPKTPPVLTVLGGKITTYRRLAEEALDKLRPHLPVMGPAWTAHAALPGGDLPGGNFEAYLKDLRRRHPGLDPAYVRLLARRYGTRAETVIGDAKSMADLGALITPVLTEREVLYQRLHEWARTPEDVLWRRTKAGVPLDAAARTAAAAAIERVLGA